MIKESLREWQAAFTKADTPLDIFINGSYLIRVSGDELDEFVAGAETLNPTTTVKVFTVQPLKARKVVMEGMVNPFSNEYIPPTYDHHHAKDITKFYNGDPISLALDFGSMEYAQMFYRDVWAWTPLM
ncbi:MAG: hypothetical protein H9W81_13540 [Enterococcus sp.]|nr:hypothetical protein [Enterococcus sp.]